MKSYESLIESNPEKIEDLSDYIAYCKFYFKPKRKKQIKFYNNLDEIKEDFPFLTKGNNSKYKSNDTLKDFPLNWLKNEIIEEEKFIDFKDDNNIEKIKQISGIYDNQQDLKDLHEYIENLPKYSFAIWFKFKLKTPYFSEDDDEFYIIQNSVLKETNFKVPMVRGSAWKGALASAFRELINKDNDLDRKKEKIDSFLRVFGAGSESVKAIEQALLKESGSFEKAKEGILLFLFFELGLEITGKDLQKAKNIKNKNDLRNFIKDKLSKKLENNQKLPIEFQTHKGRAIFYPTYFDKLSLEIINPHDRRKRAGKNPIHYEVVPKETEGIFQLIYIPFDAILKTDEEVGKESEEDLKNITDALKILSEKGIGAKTKLGWGRFKFLDGNQKVCLNSDLKFPEGWERCRS